MVTVRDLLRSKGEEGIWAVSPDTSTLDALRFMADRKIGALIVLDEGILAGILSERDLVYRIAENRSIDLETPIGEYMTSKVITVTSEHTINDCMNIMVNRRIRHLPVLDEDKLVGLVSIGDVVKGIISEQTDKIYNLENFITGTGYGR